MTYDGVNLIMTLTDVVVNKTFTHTFPINIPATIGSNLGVYRLYRRLWRLNLEPEDSCPGR